MKFLVLFFALAVWANAQRRSSIVDKTEIVEKIEMQSASAMIAIELFETKFHVPAELANISLIFRNLPVSLAKEMVAFIDSNSNHFDSFSQYSAQAASIFGHVWEQIDVNEVIAVINIEILSPLLTEIIVKLGATLGPFVKVCFHLISSQTFKCLFNIF